MAYLVVVSATSIAASVGLFKSLSDAVYALLTLTCGAAAIAGAIINRPRCRWPWFVCGLSTLFFIPSGVLRAAVNSTGDLSPTRNLLPDFLAVPGYACFAIGLLGMARTRRGSVEERSAVLDSLILCLGTFLIGWVLLIHGIVADLEASTRAKIAILAYPPLSVLLVALASVVAFSSGSRSLSHRLVLLGMVILLFGDVSYLLVEVHIAGVGEGLPMTAYGLSYSLLGAAALHPSMRTVAAPPRRRSGGLTRSRMALTAGAIVVPSALLPLWTGAGHAERIAVSVLAALLSLAAAARFATASHEQARSEARLAYEATHDGLTGLPNRTLILERLETLLDDPRNEVDVCAIFIDIDQFKMVNDSLGHAMGDQLLQAIAQRLRTSLPLGAVVARLSGDEFLIVGSGLDHEAVSELAAGVQEAISSRPVDIGSEVFVTASIGVSMCLQGGPTRTPLDLIREADTAMYHAKSSGRNMVTFYEDSMGEEVATRVSLERQLRLALLRRELTVHYQPIVSLATGRIESFEALARWNDEDGPIPPSTFIPIAEDAGLIVPLGRIVLEEACAQLALWRTWPGGKHVTMSVNLSVRQLRESGLTEDVRHLLRQHSLPGAALWLEVTESVMLDDFDTTVSKLNELRSLGVRLSVDDFGTGFSSLSYLKKLPVSRVKIDRSFVSDLGPSQSDRTLVRAIVAMAAALEMDTIAEGIERAEQADILTSLGCTYGQGYLYSRPVPPDAFAGFDQAPFVTRAACVPAARHNEQ